MEPYERCTRIAHAGAVAEQNGFEEKDNPQRGVPIGVRSGGDIRSENTRRTRPETVKVARGGPKPRRGPITQDV